MKPRTFTLIGAGSVATHFGQALCQAGLKPFQVFSRTMTSAERLAKVLNAQPVTAIQQLDDEAEVFVVALTDNVIPAIVPQLCDGRKEKLFFHTAGSVSINVFKPYAKHYGVIYPLQTLSVDRQIDMGHVPLFVEGESDRTVQILTNLACDMGARQVCEATSEQRKYLHLAAVFACNFTNHCYDIAQRLLTKEGYDFSLIRPLIQETAEKTAILNPTQAQTGPARRHDTQTIQKHLDMLSDETMYQNVYKILTESIQAAAKG